MPVRALSLTLFALIQVLVASQTNSSNVTIVCNGRGYLGKKGTCECTNRFDVRALDCSKTYPEVLGSSLPILCVVMIVIHLIACYISTRYLLKVWALRNLQAFCFACVACATFLRALFFIDPFGVYGIFPEVFASIINIIPILAATWVYTAFFLFWLEALANNKATGSDFVNKFLAHKLLAISSYTVVLMVLVVVDKAQLVPRLRSLLAIVYNLIIGTVIVAVSTCVVIVGSRVINNMLQRLYTSRRAGGGSGAEAAEEAAEQGIKKLKTLLILAAFIGYVGTLDLGLYTLLGWRWKPTMWFWGNLVSLRIMMLVGYYNILRVMQPPDVALVPCFSGIKVGAAYRASSSGGIASTTRNNGTGTGTAGTGTAGTASRRTRTRKKGGSGGRSSKATGRSRPMLLANSELQSQFCPSDSEEEDDEEKQQPQEQQAQAQQG